MNNNELVSDRSWQSFNPADFMDDLKGRDPERALTWVSEESEWHVPGDPKLGGTVYKGPDGFRQFASVSLTLFPDSLERLWHRVWHAPGATILEQRMRGDAITKREYVNNYVFVFVHGKDGRLLEVREYQDMLPLHEVMEGWEGAL